MNLTRTANIDDLRELARRRLPKIVFDFFDGGAEDEVTLRDNRAAFERIRFAPRVLRDVAEVDAASEILGGPSKYPLVIAPVGGIGLGWPGLRKDLPQCGRCPREPWCGDHAPA